MAKRAAPWSLPGSKSISNRVLLLAALAEGDTEVLGLLDSDDTRVMLDALSKLGVERYPHRRSCGPRAWHGGQFPNRKADLSFWVTQARARSGRSRLRWP